MSEIVYPRNVSALNNESLRELLVANGVPNDTILSMRRPERVEKVQEFKDKSAPSVSTVTQVIESTKIEEDTTTALFASDDDEHIKPSQETPTAVKTEVKVPWVTDKDWNPYLLTHFSEEELIEKRPTCDGLRRVFEVLIGEIIGCDCEVLQVPDVNNNNRATVSCKLTYRAYLSNTVKTITDATDVSVWNTELTFAKFPVATACTVAESRCLRKGLRYKGLSREESNQPTIEQQKTADIIMSSTSKATDNQKNAIVKLCTRLAIDPAKLLSSIPSITGGTLDTLDSNEATEVMKVINDYQRGPDNGGKAIPDSLMKV